MSDQGVGAVGRDDDGAGGVSIERLRTIVEASHLNFLVGAGTSSAFFDLLGDVEDVLTGLAAAEGDPLAKRLARAMVQKHFFTGVIEPNLQLLAGSSRANELLRSYASFGRVLNYLLLSRRSSLLNKKLNLFTTNVDLAFEAAFERLGLELNDGFVGKFRPVYDPGLFGALRHRIGAHFEHRAEVPTFDLHKLHGSVGWRIANGSQVPSMIEFDTRLELVHEIRTALDTLGEAIPMLDADQDLTVPKLLEIATEVRAAPDGLEEFEKAYERLMIVNPEKQKFATTVLTETYYELIRRFANELERENSVLFVHGFSFRDEHLRRIIVRAARTNPTLQVVTFCYSLGDRDAFRSLIHDDAVPNRNFVYITPPEEGDVRLTLDEVVERYFVPLSTAARLADGRLQALFPTTGLSPEQDTKVADTVMAKSEKSPPTGGAPDGVSTGPEAPGVR